VPAAGPQAASWTIPGFAANLEDRRPGSEYGGRHSSMARSIPNLLVAACLLAGPAAALQQIPTPEQHLGRPVGADFVLADWQEVSGYFRKLGAESPRVRVETVGTTTEGRDFVLAVITSRANHARMAELREHARVLHDPRGVGAERLRRAVEDGKPFLMISCNMHSTETAAPQFAMEFAWRLATSEEPFWQRVREETVVLLMPSVNPDGLDRVVSWYREQVGGPFEGSGLTELYQKYAGHDNNRDWFALTQAETQIVTRLLYKEWRPQVYWDVHEQGNRAERFFVPPFRDPLNPNLDPVVIAGIDALGSRALLDMTRAGFTGISTGVSYDMWWNGGNRNVPVRHNVVGLLTEAAGVNIASPVWLPRSALRAPSGLDGYAPSHRFLAPWPGGWWRLRDVIDYELAFGRSLLGSLAREPQLWLRNAMDTALRNVDQVRHAGTLAWLVPADVTDADAAYRLAELLDLSGVELDVAVDGLVADGRKWPPGSLVVRMDQPYATHVQDLFELQRYPEGAPPYDVAGWTLPVLFGLDRVEVRESMTGRLERARTPAEAVAAFHGDPRDSSAESSTWKALFRDLAAGGRRVFRVEGADAGTFAAAGPGLVLEGLPRIGVYAPWSGSMNEGWTRWVLEQFGLPYTTVRNETLRAGRLADILDVLVLPGDSAQRLDAGRAEGSAPARFTGGLDPEGAVAVEEFVRGGGTLVALGRSGEWVVALLDLPLSDPTRAAGAAFGCPGSILRTLSEPHAFTAGLPASLPIFFADDQAWQADTKRAEEEGRVVEVLLRYAPTRVLMSGYLQGEELIAGEPAWVRVAHGAGHAHLIGFRPQYRGWSQAAFGVLFRALLFESVR